MALRGKRNERKYKQRKFNPASGRQFRLEKPFNPAEPEITEKPFSLDDPIPSFEDWLAQRATLESLLAADEACRLRDAEPAYTEDEDIELELELDLAEGDPA